MEGFILTIGITLAEKLASMMLMILVGFIMVRTGRMGAKDARPLSALLVYVLQPCLIVQAFMIDLDKQKMQGFVTVLVFSFCAYGVWIVLTHFIKKPFRLDPIDQTCLIYANVGNLVLPVVSMVMGDEVLLFAATVQIPFNLLMWTHAQMVISESGSLSVKWVLKKIFFNANVLAVFFGVFLMLTGLRLPGVLDTATESLAAMVGPTAMLSIGMSIAESDLKKIFLNRKAYLIAFGRLVVYPSIILILLFSSGVLRHNPALLPVMEVAFITMTAPPANSISQIAILYHKREVEAGVYAIIGTLLCTLTMPLMIMLFSLLFRVGT